MPHEDEVFLTQQHAKVVVSNSLGLGDFVFNLPDGQVVFFEEFD